MEELDFSGLLACCSDKGRTGYNPIMMYAVVTYANMRGVRAVDRIVELCQSLPLRSTKPPFTSFSMTAARVAGVPSPRRSASGSVSPFPARSIADNRLASDKCCKVLMWIISDFFQGIH